MKQVLEESMKTQPIPTLAPESNDPNAFEIRLRLPNGQTCTRRFLPSDILQSILDWGIVETQGLNLRLVTTFPRRILVEYQKTLQELGFGPLDNTIVAEKDNFS
mmetsp:Transcript_34024/g.6138  ORF Transcript_34024/g.6138 Transcript_34024/m.6138 type:complete len:104 (+) Transcript_34024:1-312(+)